MSKKNKDKLPYSFIGKYDYDGRDDGKKQKKKDLIKILRKTKSDVEKKCHCNHIDKHGEKHLKLIQENLYECKICGARITTDPDLLKRECVESMVIIATSVLNKFRTLVPMNEGLYNDISHCMEIIYKCPEIVDAINRIQEEKAHKHHDDYDDYKKGKHGKHKKKHKHHDDDDDYGSRKKKFRGYTDY